LRRFRGFKPLLQCHEARIPRRIQIYKPAADLWINNA
jgi:hypothetical protein